MPDDQRIVEIEILDDLTPELVTKAIDFFHREYPNDSKEQIDSDFFSAKLGSSNPNGRGYFSVATYDGLVVGTCTAVRKTLVTDNRIIDAVEIGDTFTSKSFRKSCYFSQLYPGTTSPNDYLNKSIFGRLATETLDRARADGVEYVYGTPNVQAKLSWLGRMNFKLVDGGFIYRITSASLTHPFYNSSIAFRALGAIYTKTTHLLCLITTRSYSINLISKNEFSDLPDRLQETSYKSDIQLVNSYSWIRSRFVENSDKEYRIVKIEKRGTSEICGYLFFLEHNRVDGFKLLILSKALLYDKKLERLKIPISKVAAGRFFKYENLSMWVDLRRNSIKYRILFGFLSKEFKVDIVAKCLTEKGAALETKNLYNFEYGDADLA